MKGTVFPEPALHPDASVKVMKIGREQHPVLIVDQALENAEALRAYACAGAAFVASAAGSRYPGQVAGLPDGYLSLILKALIAPMAVVFGHPKGHPIQPHGFFGLTTAPPAEMETVQRLPHADSSHRHAYASVHFLSGRDFGGTAFYRHKATGIEVVTPDNSQTGYLKRQAELDALKGSPYREFEDLYEEIAYIEPRFNRLIFYRAGQLHSAKITSAAALPNDPRTGRLTANLFINT